MATAVPFGLLALSIEDLPGPAFVLDGPEGRVVLHNEAFAGWACRADATGLSLADLFPGDHGAARLFREAREGGAGDHHVERRAEDGRRSFWSLRARRTPAGVLVVLSDLTPLASATEAVHAAACDYVAVAAHELRAPLGAIKAWAGALSARRSPGSVEADGLGAIGRQVDRMNDLLTDLFDAARAGAGALRADRAHVQVDTLVRHTRAASPWSARMEIAAGMIGSAFVDAPQIEAVLGRAVGWIAARQAAGPIQVSGSLGADEILITLTDRGPELSRRAEGDLFGRGIHAGRGLGLYLCQHLAAANGGRIWRERDGAAARIVLALPRAAPPPRDPGPARVLWADADSARRARAIAVLGLQGCEADGAGDGAELLHRLSSGAWEVVVVDLSVAGSLDALAWIRARPGDPPAVLVIAPSAERGPSLEGAERAGALAVMRPPVDWPHLLSLLACAASARSA